MLTVIEKPSHRLSTKASYGLLINPNSRCRNNSLAQIDPIGLEGYWSQVGHFLLGEVRGFIDGLVGAPDPPGVKLPNPLEPTPVSNGGNEAENDGYKVGHVLTAVFYIAYMSSIGDGNITTSPRKPDPYKGNPFPGVSP